MAEIVEAVIRDLTGETAIDKGVGEDESMDDAGGLVLVWEREREKRGGVMLISIIMIYLVPSLLCMGQHVRL